MKALLFTLIVVFTIGQSYAQLCNGNIVYNSTAEFCPYPGGKSCCDPVIFDGYRDLLDQALIGLPKDCKEYYRGLFCSACDPLSRGEVMCKSFCMKFVKGCLSDFPGGGDFICGDLPDTYCFKGFDFDPLPPREICGVFGDPHVRLFDGSGKTCKSAGTVTYFKSSDLLIEGTNTVVDTTTGATAITSLKVTYKGETETFNVGSYYPSFSGNDVSDVPLFGGRTYTFLSIDTRLSTRIASNEIFFTISSPNKGETSICKSGCPGQEINILSFPNGRRMAQAQAEEDCIEAGLEKGSFHFKACVYDVSVTGDKNYALSAKEYSNVEADALAEEEYRKKSSAIENTINVFVILISALIALVQF